LDDGCWRSVEEGFWLGLAWLVTVGWAWRIAFDWAERWLVVCTKTPRLHLVGAYQKQKNCSIQRAMNCQL